MDRIRWPFYIVAVIFMVVAIVIELAAAEPLARLVNRAEPGTPGIAIEYLAIWDAIIVYSLAWDLLEQLSKRITALIEGGVTLVVAIIGLITAFGLAIGAFALLMVMISLLLSVPFGTIAYIAAWGDFATEAAAATLTLVMLLKILFFIFLLLAQQRFLQLKGRVLLIAVSIGLTWVIAFVHAFLPGFLVAIGDAALALVIAVIGLIWILLLALFSLRDIFRAILSLRRLGLPG